MLQYLAAHLHRHLPHQKKSNSPRRLSISGGNVIRLDAFLPNTSDRSEEVNRGFPGGRVQSARSRQSSARAGRPEDRADKGYSGKISVKAAERASWPLLRSQPRTSTSPERSSIVQQRMAQMSSQQSFSGNRKLHLEDSFRVSPIQKQRLDSPCCALEPAASTIHLGASDRRRMQGSNTNPPRVPSRRYVSGRSRR